MTYLNRHDTATSPALPSATIRQTFTESGVRFLQADTVHANVSRREF